jgi:hypothetical protein
MEGNGQLHVPADSPLSEMSLHILWITGLMDLRDSMDAALNIFNLNRIRITTTVQPVDSRYTNYDISAPSLKLCKMYTEMQVKDCNLFSIEDEESICIKYMYMYKTHIIVYVYYGSLTLQ